MAYSVQMGHRDTAGHHRIYSNIYLHRGGSPCGRHRARAVGSGSRSHASSVLLVTIWELGEAAGPLLIAPLSEMYGRYPVINGANMLFIVATVLAATS
ncbi:hypothetical protein B0T18DRAFT_409707 [Schizothecium vesticola]|uniref:Major facilitator superfamily (MFS) profile domain-containing protein n=1 Tax=Schizothecium vesticola TaxID=314040 RepID=A0AA40EU21_9PEZI|nr:hypothetical protein B0T18DRAFT_409707 [Schizothecium vesticola]